ncbi:hypothetical protein TWF481_002041 [Arthrobotrys musiformis]|uniref:Uncharacterized protein n=1 Tax=Arthrobotrys musiformis TaxID=47236 RepID=A0AAV9VS80_9PEZI
MSSLQNYLRLSLIICFLVFFRLSICPDPEEIVSSADLNPQQPTIADISAQPKNLIPITEQQYEKWYLENSQMLSYIALQMEWLQELRVKCPLGPSPSIAGQPGGREYSPRSLSYLIRTLRAALASFQEDMVTMSRPVADLYEVGKLIRETLGWSKNEAPAQSKKIVDVLKRGISQMRAFWEQYYFLEGESRDNWTKLPGEDSSARALFVATTIARPEPAVIQSEAGPDVSILDPGILQIDADSVGKRIKALQAQLRWIKYAANVGHQWVEEAIDRELDNPVYTQVLNREKYDPDHRRGLRNLDFNLVTIFEKAVDWYTCWLQPIQNMVMLLEQLTPLPGTREEEEEMEVPNAHTVQGSPYTYDEGDFIEEEPSPELEGLRREIKIQEDGEQWSIAPIGQDYAEDTVLKEEDDGRVEEEEVKIESSQEQWSNKPIYEDYLEDIVFKEEDDGAAGEGPNEIAKAKNPNVMSLEDVEDVSTQQPTYREEGVIFLGE